MFLPFSFGCLHLGWSFQRFRIRIRIFAAFGKRSRKEAFLFRFYNNGLVGRVSSTGRVLGAVRCDMWHRNSKAGNGYFVSPLVLVTTYHERPLTLTTPPVRTAVSGVGFLGPRTDLPRGRAWRRRWRRSRGLLNRCTAGNQYAGWGREDSAR